MKNIKEYIYFDTAEINSILSQLDDGLVTVQQELQQALSGTENHSETSGENEYKAGASLVVNGEAKYKRENKQGTSNQEQTISARTIESVYNDYAVNVIEKRLDSQQRLQNSTDVSDGSFVKVTSNYSVLEFSTAKSLFSGSELTKIMNIDAQESLTANSMMTMFDASLKSSTLIRLSKATIIAENNNFRMNLAQRQMLQLRKSKVTVLGIIESKVEDSDLNSNLEDLNNHPELLGNFGTKLSLMLWAQLKAIKIGDRLIKPIAIYFE